MTFSFWACTEGPIERRRELIKSTMFLNPEGKISMKDPDSTIYMVEDYGKVPAEAPRRVYIGPLVGVAQRATIKQFSLRSRKLIGNTVTLPPPPTPRLVLSCMPLATLLCITGDCNSPQLEYSLWGQQCVLACSRAPALPLLHDTMHV